MKRMIMNLVVMLVIAMPQGVRAQGSVTGSASDDYQYKETRELVQLVTEAADLLRVKGEAAFADFRVPGSRWRQEETYIFVVDPKGNMLVHPDPSMEGMNELDLKDINGKLIIRGLLAETTAFKNKTDGWYHYQWPVPGGLLPRWKSAYVRLATTPSGSDYVVGSGMYNDRMERSFVVDEVRGAVGAIEKNGEAAFPLFRDPTSPYIAKDSYIFVIDRRGIELVNPAFPNLEGRDILDVKDTQGKQLVREMLDLVQTHGSGWVDYMWPKPGESVSTQKSAYVSRALLGGDWVLVGSGVYLVDAPKAISTRKEMTAPELMTLVREAAAVFEQHGEKAFPEFRSEGSKWFRDGTYFFVWTSDGTRLFNAAIPTGEGEEVSGLTDVRGRPIGKMLLGAAASPGGEGWVHYMYPEPGDIFPTWKSTFVKRVTFPSGINYVIGSGIYNMQMDEAFIEDVVNRAAALVAERGEEAFPVLRDKTGPFFFMDTYVFVNTLDGVEHVNPAQPSMEGKNVMGITDLNGKFLVADYIAAAVEFGSAWVDYVWYKPGNNTPAYKHTYVRTVQSGNTTYVIGSGFYLADESLGLSASTRNLLDGDTTMTTTMTNTTMGIQKISLNVLEKEKMSDCLTRQTVYGEKATVAKLFAKPGGVAERHSHPSEEFSLVTSGTLKFIFDDRELVANAGELVVIPPNVPHGVVALEDAEFIDFFAPAREDWLRGEDKYLRK